MADGITVQWKDRSNGNVSLCDGPVRGQDRFLGPLDDSGGSQLSFSTQPLPGLRATAQNHAARGNATESFQLRVSRECSTHALAFYFANIWPSTLAPQANLIVTFTTGVSLTTCFLNNAVIQSLGRDRRGVAVDFTFRFTGGLWTTN